jgi:hypothetical protein
VPKRFKWTLSVEVDETWVADGFDFTPDRVQEMSESLIAYAYPSEVKVKVVTAPDPRDVRRAQGYDDPTD